MVVAGLITIIHMLQWLRDLFILSLWNPAVSVTEVTGTTPTFYSGAPVLDGSLEAVCLLVSCGGSDW